MINIDHTCYSIVSWSLQATDNVIILKSFCRCTTNTEKASALVNLIWNADIPVAKSRKQPACATQPSNTRRERNERAETEIVVEWHINTLADTRKKHRYTWLPLVTRDNRGKIFHTNYFEFPRIITNICYLYGASGKHLELFTGILTMDIKISMLVY